MTTNQDDERARELSGLWTTGRGEGPARAPAGLSLADAVMMGLGELTLAVMTLTDAVHRLGDELEHGRDEGRSMRLRGSK